MASLFFSCFNVTPILGYGICICIYLSFFRYSIRNTFSLCQAQIFFCIIIFFSMEFKVVFFFSVCGTIWKTFWESLWLDETGMECSRDPPRNPPRGILAGRQRKADCYVAQASKDWAFLFHVCGTCSPYCFKIKGSYLCYLSPNNIHCLSSQVDAKDDERLRNPTSKCICQAWLRLCLRILHGYEIDPYSYAHRRRWNLEVYALKRVNISNISLQSPCTKQTHCLGHQIYYPKHINITLQETAYCLHLFWD